MKLERKISIDDHELLVIFSYFGFEKYFLNGALFRKAWSFKFKGKREFQMGTREFVIDVSAIPGQYYCKVYLDSELYIEGLFPEFRKQANVL